MKAKKINKTRELLRGEFIKTLTDQDYEGIWHCGWKIMRQERNNTGKEYRGINQIVLTIIAQHFGYKDNRWFTYNQATDKEKGTYVRAGSKSVPIEYPTAYLIRESKMSKEKFEELLISINKTLGKNPYSKTKNGTKYINNFFSVDEAVRIVNMDEFKGLIGYSISYKNYNVFNAEQIEGIKPRILESKIDENKIQIAQKVVDNYLKNENIDLSYNNSEAYYVPSQDKISIPRKELFDDEERYISTIVHEIAHSTSKDTRNNRITNTNKESEQYAREELIAEISSVFLCNELDIELDRKHIDNHKGYIQHWIEHIKDEEKGEKFIGDVLKEVDKTVKFVLEKGEYEKVLDYYKYGYSVEDILKIVEDKGFTIDTYVLDNDSKDFNINLSLCENEGICLKNENEEYEYNSYERNQAALIYNGKVYCDYEHIEALFNAFIDNKIIINDDFNTLSNEELEDKYYFKENATERIRLINNYDDLLYIDGLHFMDIYDDAIKVYSEKDLIKNFTIIKDYAEAHNLKVMVYDKGIKVHEVDMDKTSQNITSVNFVSYNQDKPLEFIKDFKNVIDNIQKYDERYGSLYKSLHETECMMSVNALEHEAKNVEYQLEQNEISKNLQDKGELNIEKAEVIENLENSSVSHKISENKESKEEFSRFKNYGGFYSKKFNAYKKQIETEKPFEIMKGSFITENNDVLQIIDDYIEPTYEYFVPVTNYYLNDEVLFKRNSKNIEPYKNEEYISGRFKSEDEVLKFLQDNYSSMKMYNFNEKELNLKLRFKFDIDKIDLQEKSEEFKEKIYQINEFLSIESQGYYIPNNTKNQLNSLRDELTEIISNLNKNINIEKEIEK